MFKNTISRFSLVSLVEGLSLLVLLFVAIPAKYIFLHDGLVELVAPIHGGIFLLYLVFGMTAALQYKWSVKTSLVLLIASIAPFGNFYCEYKIIRPQIKKLEEVNNSQSPTSAENSNKGAQRWLKRIGISSFLFFLIKGLIWLGIFMGLFKGCT